MEKLIGNCDVTSSKVSLYFIESFGSLGWNCGCLVLALTIVSSNSTEYPRSRKMLVVRRFKVSRIRGTGRFSERLCRDAERRALRSYITPKPARWLLIVSSLIFFAATPGACFTHLGFVFPPLFLYLSGV